MLHEREATPATFQSRESSKAQGLTARRYTTVAASRRFSHSMFGRRPGASELHVLSEMPRHSSPQGRPLRPGPPSLSQDSATAGMIPFQSSMPGSNFLILNCLIPVPLRHSARTEMALNSEGLCASDMRSHCSPIWTRGNPKCGLAIKTSQNIQVPSFLIS